MIIYSYNDYKYTTDDLIMGKPVFINNLGCIYPILVKDWNCFCDFGGYLGLSKKHMNLKKVEDLLPTLITMIVNVKSKKCNTLDDKIKQVEYVIDGFCKMFSLLCRKKITFDDETFSFIGDGVMINQDNYNILRNVVLKMNLLKEPKIYEDSKYGEYDRYWEEKALKAKKGKDITLGEMMIILRGFTKESYETIANFNIFQFNSDYLRATQVYNYETLRELASNRDGIQIPPFSDEIINALYKDPTKDLNIKGDFTKMITV